MIDMRSLIEQVPLRPAQEEIRSEKARKLAKLRNLELQTRKEIELLSSELNAEEVKTVEATFIKKEEELIDDVPKYLSAAEVAGIMGISPQMVRRNCVSGKYQGYQPSGSNGIWFINSNTFRNDPKENWADFISRRNDMYARSKESAELALKLLDEEIEELDVDETEE